MGDGNGDICRRAGRTRVLEYPPILPILVQSQILAHPLIPLILVQMPGAGEFNSPLPWMGILVQKSLLPFRLTSFDPHSENSQRKPSYPPHVPEGCTPNPRVRSGRFPSFFRTIPEHAPNESRRRPHKIHLKFRSRYRYRVQIYLAFLFFETLARGL